VIPLFHIYRAHFLTWTAVQLQYRVAMIIWLIGTIIDPIIYLVVWSTVADASDGAVGGFTQSDFSAYFIASMVVNHLTFTWHMWEYDYIIRQGLLSPRLLRPFHPIHADIAENISYKVITLVVTIPTTVGLILIFKPVFTPSIQSLIAFVPALVLAFLVQFMMGWALAMVAFWTTRINAIARIYFLGKLFLAGQLAPLALLPPSLQTVASISPYRWMLSFPVELLLGRLESSQIGWGLLIQMSWVALSIVIVKRVWKAGVKRYSAFGS
jgi:ABC-2 type transport system permease protein